MMWPHLKFQEHNKEIFSEMSGRKILKLSYGDETRAGRTRTHTTDAIPNLNVRYTNAERSSQQRTAQQGHGRCSGSSGAKAREGINARRAPDPRVGPPHPLVLGEVGTLQRLNKALTDGAHLRAVPLAGAEPRPRARRVDAAHPASVVRGWPVEHPP